MPEHLYLKRGIKFLRKLKNSKGKCRKKILKNIKPSQLRILSESCYNVARNPGIKLSPNKRRFFSLNKKSLQYLSSPDISFKKKKHYLNNQTGSAIILPIVSAVLPFLVKEIGKLIHGKK
jgi:hypothetical protein